MNKHIKYDQLSKINPFEAAVRGAGFSGEISLSSFERLAALTSASGAPLVVNIQFRYDDQRKVVMDMQLSTALQVWCERCREELLFPCEISEVLQPVRTLDALKEVSAAYEPCEALDNTLNILDIIEDSLLLSLPISARHDHCAESTVQ